MFEPYKQKKKSIEGMLMLDLHWDAIDVFFLNFAIGPKIDEDQDVSPKIFQCQAGC